MQGKGTVQRDLRWVVAGITQEASLLDANVRVLVLSLIWAPYFNLLELFGVDLFSIS
jgi:hypothetical protein